MKKAVKYTLCAGAGVAGTILLSAAIYMPFVICDANKLYCDNCDYLLILGGDIIGADSPSPQLFERMKRAADYLKNHPNTIAIPCGGCFRKEQKKSEAQVIANYLISEGIEEGRIVLEDKSTTTFENFLNAINIIENINSGKNKNPKIAFLSSSYHIHRASIIASMCGLENIGRVTAKTPGSAAKRYVREYFVAYELLLKKMGLKK